MTKNLCATTGIIRLTDINEKCDAVEHWINATLTLVAYVNSPPHKPSIIAKHVQL
jgi:hypothetical protein